MSEEFFDNAVENTSDSADSNLETPQRESRILVLRDYCIRLNGSECTRCANACPHEAISYEEDGIPTVDAQRCSNCGICFGICDAFSSNRVTLIDLNARVRRIALRGDAVYFTCRENIFPELNPAANVIVLPCLACLPPEFWTLILAEGVSTNIACDLSYCTDCERAGDIAETLYTHSIKTAERWTRKKVRFSELIPEKDDLITDISAPEGVDRRGAFDNLIGDLGDIVSGKRRLRNSEVLQQFVERRERSKAINQLRLSEIEEINQFAPLGHTKKTMVPKRKMLLEALQQDPSIASRIPLYLAKLKDKSALYEKSDSYSCPTGALYPNPDTGEIIIEKRYCIGCELCTYLYPTSVLEITKTTAVTLTKDESTNPTDTLA